MLHFPRINRTFAPSNPITHDKTFTQMNELHFGRFWLNPQKQELLYRDVDGIAELHKLSFREASILTMLVEARGEVVENRLLLMEFWGSDNVYNHNSLYVFMSRMKQVLAADPSVRIVNARGIGYRLVQV